MEKIKWTPWSKPCILKIYKYKGYIIEKFFQVETSSFSIHHRTRFRGIKNGKIVTKEYIKYSQCINEIKYIIKNGK